MTKKQKLPALVPVPTTTGKQQRLIYFAKKNLGKPYKYGAKSWQAPKIFDCSTLIQYLYKKVGIDLPRTALQQAHFGKEVKLNELEPGDLIFIHSKWGHYNPEFPQGIGHVAMYIGDNKVIHASSKENSKWRTLKGKVKGGVVQETIKEYLQGEKLVVIKRILE